MKKLLFVILFQFSLCFYGQNLPQIIPPSPQTQEVEKFINFDVSLYNGLADISIPFYTIELNGVAIPIGISYHASGIKKGQTNGEVGVGWVFNPGYRISRTIYGHPDESAPMATGVASTLLSLPNGAEKDKYLSRFLSQTDYNSQPSRGTESKLDGEFDQFNYSLPTGGGSFIITDRTLKEVAMVDKANVAIDYTIANGLTGLKATDDWGNSFYFGQQLSTNNLDVFEVSPRLGGNHKTAWALTDLITPLGEQVHFKYKQGSSGSWSSHMKTFTFYEAYPPYETPSNYTWTDGVDNSSSTFYLEEISSQKEKILITRNSANAITKIEIKTLENVLIKSVELYYSQIGHLFLDSLKIFDSNNIEGKEYTFNYYSKGEAPADFSHDQWGYYMKYGFTGPASAHLYHEEFFDDQIQVDQGFSKETLALLIDEGADRSHLTEFAVPSYFSLQKITYPTGGSTEYIYEHNKYKDFHDVLRNGGGIRIKQIRKYDDNSEPELIRDYVYGESESGYGEQVVPISHELFTSEGVHFFYNVDAVLRQQRIINYSTTLNGDIDPGGFIASNIVYPEVTEYYTSKNNNDWTGKVIYKYQTGTAYNAGTLLPQLQFIPVEDVGFQYWPLSPLYVRQYKRWNKPYLTQKEYFSYNKVSETFADIYKEEFFYDAAVSTYTGLKVRPFAYATDYLPKDPKYYDFVPSFFNYDEYTVTTAQRRLIEKKESWSNGGGPALTSKLFSYNSRGQIISETTHTSGNEEIKRSYNYPFEMVSAGKDPNGVYAGMINKNIVSPIIEEITFNDNVQQFFTKSNYSIYSGKYLLSSVETLKGIPSSSNEPTTRLIYHNYHVSGKPLEISRTGGPHIVYLWSTDRNPIAEIVNATALQVANALGTTVQGLSNINEGNLTSINLLRNTLLKSQITTFTYKPLVGVATVTDPKGYTTKYTYDACNRLYLIKDDDGNILSENQYNYRDQSSQ